LSFIDRPVGRGLDAQYLAELLRVHHAKLKAWQPDDSQTRQLLQLVYHITEQSG
jgi:hypothetical protein